LTGKGKADGSAAIRYTKKTDQIFRIDKKMGTRKSGVTELRKRAKKLQGSPVLGNQSANRAGDVIFATRKEKTAQQAKYWRRSCKIPFGEANFRSAEEKIAPT